MSGSQRHNYTTTVVNVLAPQAPAPLPPPLKPLQDDMLFSGNFFKVTSAYIETMLAGYHFDEPNAVVPKSAEVMALTEQWSSYAQGFEYDPNKCELWVEPNWLHVWLRTAWERKYN